MKKILALITILTILVSTISGLTLISFAETVTVVADKGWENATYDANTGILTNVDGGYSFKVEGSTISYNGSELINTAEVVIPSAYNGTAITTVGSYALNGKAVTTSTTAVVVSEGIATLSVSALRNLTNVKSLKLPSTLTSFGSNAFMAMSSLTEITIPEGVTNISENSFSGCTKLEKINYSQLCNIKNIYPKAFYNCQSLKSIIIPDTISIIGESAFYGCKNATELYIGSGVTRIGVSVFSGCSKITSVSIPAAVVSISDNAFANCPLITAFNVAEGNTTFTTENGILYNADKTILYAYPAASAATTYVAPDALTALKPYAFSDAANLTSISLTNTITSLPAYCFNNCKKLTGFSIPSGVTSLGNYCFNYCESLTELVVPAGVTVIPDYCFIWCTGLESLAFMGDITEIKQFACGRLYALEKLTFKSKAAPATIGRSPFYGLPANCTVYYPSNGTGYTETKFTSVFNANQIYETLTGTPEAKVSISGVSMVGETITGSYVSYTDPQNRPENGSKYVWQISDDPEFKSNVVDLQTGTVSVGNNKTYKLTDAAIGKYIRFGVTPKNAGTEDNVGNTEYAALSAAVRKPVTTPVVVLTSPYNGYKCHQNTDVVLSATATCDNADITKIEYYANDALVATADKSPFESSWSPAEPDTYEIYAIAYNSLNETGRSGSVSIKVYSLEESIESVAAEKWCYDFSLFKDGNTYTSDTGLTLPGDYAPTVAIGKGATVTNATGVFGNSADNYSMQVNSIEGNNNGITISYNKSTLDNPVNNVMLEVDVAVTAVDEIQYILSYNTPKGKYLSFQLDADGTMGYFTDYPSRTLKKIKDESGNNLIMETGRWYRFGLLLDFENGEVAFYLDGEELEKVKVANTYGFTSLSNAQIQNIHSAAGKTGIMYLDNLRLSQVQDSYVTSVVSSLADIEYKLTGSDILFEGYAKDSRPGKSVDFVEIYANDKLIKTTDGDSFSFNENGLAPGKYKITTKAVSTDGLVGYSPAYNLTVSSVSFPTMYGDDMLLQRNKEIKLFGYGVNGAKVTASICGKSATATVADGVWNIVLPQMPATKSTQLSISTDDGVTTTFNNVAIGELIICSGQSNMQYILNNFSKLKGEADKDYADIRLYNQPVTGTGSPQNDNDGKWRTATVHNTLDFSGFAFLTAKDYYYSQNCDVPVGLIYAAYGGSSINMWIPNGSFKNHPDTTSLSTGSTYYNKTIAPWRNFTVGHFLWYQGESNSSLTIPYEHMLTYLIDGWREAFNDDSINVIVVMLPIYDYPNKMGSVRSAVNIREAQWNVSERMNNVETVVAIDTGEAANIHPSDKLPLANRASRILQHFTTDNESIVWKSPSYDKHEYDAASNKMTIYLKDVAGGLKTSDGSAARGFKIAGDDGVFKDAAVTISGDTVIVDASSVTGTPKVRYAWESALADSDGKSIINLVNSAGLPVAPFRTDMDVYRFKTKNDDGTYSDEVNFTPITRDLTVSDVLNGEATIKVQAYDCDDTVTKVEVYCDGKLLGEATPTANNCYYTYNWTKAEEGSHSFYAVATDSHNVTSISNGSKTVTPKTYVYNVGYGNDPDIIFSGSFEEGITATAINSDGYMLVLAAYIENTNLLTCVKIVNANEKATFSINELGNSTTVKAFILKDMDNIESVSDVVYFE